MSVRHLIAEQVLIEGELVPAHVEIAGDGTIRRIHRLSPGGTSRRAAIVKAADISAGEGMRLLHSRLMVLPGAVDTHVHVNEPGHTSREGFATATMAAALAGVTTLVDMPLHSVPPTVSVEAFQAKRNLAERQAYVDVGFWGGIVPGNTDQLESLWQAGVLGFSCLLLPSGAKDFPPMTPVQLREAMVSIARLSGFVAVHAEDSMTIAAAARATGFRRNVRRYSEWAATRPEEAETTAVEGLIDAVRETGCRTHLLHISSAGAVDLIAEAKQEGLPLSAETCPHYLCFDHETIPDGSPEFTCWPPIRDLASREALWQGLAERVIDIVVSDHSPSTREEKYRGATDLSHAREGISGLQVGFAAVASEARARGIGLDYVSRWTSAGPAELLGLSHKGKISAGRDADFLIYDPDETHVVSAAGLAHKNPFSAYDGFEIHGTVVGSVLRGTELFTAQDSSAMVTQGGQLIRGAGAPAVVDAAGPLFRQHRRAVSA